jgi:protein-S-isoprenylcysteine O-methyltransferase Ste14
MDPKNYSRLAAVIFAIIAHLQVIRVLLAWEITLNGIPIPLFASGIAVFVAAALAWLGFAASRSSSCGSHTGRTAVQNGLVVVRCLYLVQVRQPRYLGWPAP